MDKSAYQCIVENIQSINNASKEKSIPIENKVLPPLQNDLTSADKVNKFVLDGTLVADYGSETDSSEIDSTPDSLESNESCSSSDESEDIGAIDEIIRPIQELNITIPSEKAEEVGQVKNFVDGQVVVEPNIGVAALDLDTVLFLDKGQRALGKIDDVFGPINRPFYTIYLGSDVEVKRRKIEPGMKVYYAPVSEHTSFVKLPEIMKVKGSDASWDYNQEAPPDCQEFSDDEEEAASRGKRNNRSQTADDGEQWNKKRQWSPRPPQHPRPPHHHNKQNFSNDQRRTSDYRQFMSPQNMDVPIYPPDSSGGSCSPFYSPSTVPNFNVPPPNFMSPGPQGPGHNFHVPPPMYNSSPSNGFSGSPHTPHNFYSNGFSSPQFNSAAPLPPHQPNGLTHFSNDFNRSSNSYNEQQNGYNTSHNPPLPNVGFNGVSPQYPLLNLPPPGTSSQEMHLSHSSGGHRPH